MTCEETDLALLSNTRASQKKEQANKSLKFAIL